MDEDSQGQGVSGKAWTATRPDGAGACPGWSDLGGRGGSKPAEVGRVRGDPVGCKTAPERRLEAAGGSAAAFPPTRERVTATCVASGSGMKASKNKGVKRAVCDVLSATGEKEHEVELDYGAESDEWEEGEVRDDDDWKHRHGGTGEQSNGRFGVLQAVKPTKDKAKADYRRASAVKGRAGETQTTLTGEGSWWAAWDGGPKEGRKKPCRSVGVGDGSARDALAATQLGTKKGTREVRRCQWREYRLTKWEGLGRKRTKKRTNTPKCCHIWDWLCLWGHIYRTRLGTGSGGMSMWTSLNSYIERYKLKRVERGGMGTH